MLGDMVPGGHSYWAMLMKLTGVTDIVFARAVSEGMCHFFMVPDRLSDINLIQTPVNG